MDEPNDDVMDREEPCEDVEDVGWDWELDLESQGHGGCWAMSRMELAFVDAFAGPSTPSRRTDVRIYEDVCELLADHPHIDAAAVEVEVVDGVVILRGAVTTRQEIALCCELLDDVAGVLRFELLVRVAPPDVEEHWSR